MVLGGGGDAEPESGTVIEVGRDADFAVEGEDDFPADGEAESGAAELAGGGIVYLIEAIEDAGELCGGDADAGIGDGETEEAWAIGSDGNFDVSVAGEFDRVEEEVQEYLADPVRIGDKIGWEGGGDGSADGDAGGGGGLHGADEVIEQWLDREGGEIDADAAGVEAGEFEDIVDDGEERAGGVADGFGELALAGAERGVEEKTGHADDGVHGCAEFVAHVGEEAFFCLGGGGELLVLGGEGVFGFAPLEEVDDEAGDDDCLEEEEGDAEEDPGGVAFDETIAEEEDLRVGRERGVGEFEAGHLAGVKLELVFVVFDERDGGGRGAGEKLEREAADLAAVVEALISGAGEKALADSSGEAEDGDRGSGGDLGFGAEAMEVGDEEEVTGAELMAAGEESWERGDGGIEDLQGPGGAGGAAGEGIDEVLRCGGAAGEQNDAPGLGLEF